MFGALEERSFRLVWLARTISSVGDAVGGIAFVFAVLEIGGSASDLGLVLGAGTLTRVVLLLVAGVWSDRLPRHLVMVGADLVRAGSAVANPRAQASRRRLQASN